MFGANDRAKFGNDRIGGFAALPPRHHPVTEVDDVVAHGGKDGAVADIAMAAPDAEDAISTAPQRVHAVLQALPDNYRRILELRFLQNCSIKDSAAELGVTVANAKVLQHRALRLAAQVNEKDER